MKKQLIKSICVRRFNKIKILITAERGQALPIVLAILSIGSLAIGPFLNHAGTTAMSFSNYQELINETYAGEAGVEQAIWQLKYGSLADDIPDPGNNKNYVLSEPVNNLYPDVTVILSTSESGENSNHNENGNNGNHNSNGNNGNHNGKGENGNHFGNTDTESIQTYLIQSIAGNTAVTATVKIADGTPSVISWSVDRK